MSISSQRKNPILTEDAKLDWRPIGRHLNQERELNVGIEREISPQDM